MKPPRFLLAISIFAIVFLTFSRLCLCRFTWWDDQQTIHENPRLNPPTWQTIEYYWTTAGEQSTMGLYIPATYTVWAGLAAIARLDHPDADGVTLDAWVFHTANVVIHALTAVAVFLMLLRLFDDGTRTQTPALRYSEEPDDSPSDPGLRSTSRPASTDIVAALGALLFALHPVQVETVAWASGTKDLLCGFFVVLSLLMYVRSVQIASVDPHHRWPRRWRYLLGFFFFILAVLSKPTAVVTPVMALIIAALLLRQTPRRAIVSLLPLFVLMIPSMIITKLVQPGTWQSPLPMWTRPLVAADAITFYLAKLLWPMHLCVDYGHGPQAIWNSGLIFWTWIIPAVIAVALWRWKTPTALASAGLFVLPLIPVLGFSSFEFQQISTTADHYLYLPMLGIALLGTWALMRIQSRWKFSVAGLILVSLGARSVLAEPVWQDTRTLFLHTLAINPNSVASTDTLGFFAGREARRNPDRLAARKQFEESIGWYQRSLQHAPDSVPSVYNLALDYQAIGDNPKAIALMHSIIEIQPHLPAGLRVSPMDLAKRLYDFPDLPDAVDVLDQILLHDPTNRLALQMRQAAIERMRKADTRITPRN
jgi:hypothetical protein